MNMQITASPSQVSGGYKVDVSRGDRIGRVSSEWFSRPDDQRFLSLDDLAKSVRQRAERSRTRIVETSAIHVEASRDDTERLALILPGADAPITPTHWSFGQLAAQVAAPAAYLRQLPAPLAAINLQYGLNSSRAEQIKTLETKDGQRTGLRAVTGPDYGRIFDHELVEAVQRIAGNGTGDTRWKVPGVLDWSTGIYNPHVDARRDTTTLYASDRDVFLFLVDDLNPIEAGRLPDGSPDLFFRGFYCWNSEVGARTLGIASFYLRAVCQNRNLWGVEDFQEISIRHSKYAATRFAHEAAPALINFANSSPQPFINGVRAARERIVARSDEDRSQFLRTRGFRKAWTPRSGSLVNHRTLTASVIDSRDFLAAKRRSETEPLLPTGTRIAFTAGPAYDDHRKIWAALDKILAKYPDMILLHGGNPTGGEHIATLWARNRKVAHIPFRPDWDRFQKAAPFRRNDAMLGTLPKAVVACPGNGINANLVDKARKMGIVVWSIE